MIPVGVTLEAAPCEDITNNVEVHNVAVSIKVPESLGLADDEVVGTDVVAVVDVSGSMGSLAVESDGVVNKDGLSILDIVKHALKTVIHILKPEDRLALVGFSTNACTVFELQGMTAENRQKALDALDLLTPQASTNIWAGLLEGMDALRNAGEEATVKVPIEKSETETSTEATTPAATTEDASSSSSNSKRVPEQSTEKVGKGKNKKRKSQNKNNEAVVEVKTTTTPTAAAAPAGFKEVKVVQRRKTLLLLTDGQPNVIPPRGHLAELRDYADKYDEFDFQISTFGFGYNLDSDLLLGLSQQGGGTFAFIPDAVIVGTVFVNAVANALSTYTQHATLQLCNA